MLVEVGRSKGQRVLPLPMGWLQGKAMGRDEPATPRSQVNNDVADLEASVVTWRHLLQGVLSTTPQAAVQVGTRNTERMRAFLAYLGFVAFRDHCRQWLRCAVFI